MAYDWMDEAACADADPELFFADGRTADSDYAKTVCARCPVSGDCLAYSDSVGAAFGTWGGYDQDERRGLRLGLRTASFPGSDW